MSVSVDVCVCTFRRPGLRALLRSLAVQAVPPGMAVRVIVADNDTVPSARALVCGLAATFPWPLIYVHAPAGNISVARNACLARAGADWVAFVDDDELAPPDWLAGLLAAARRTGADVVCAPSQALYPDAAPAWMVRADLHSNRPRARRGGAPPGHTANALLRFAGTRWAGLRFDPELGRSGGEDTAYFAAVAALGGRLALVPGPCVHEPVAPGRLSTGWLLRRSFRKGQTHFDVYLGRRHRGLLLPALGKGLACLGMAALCAPHRRLRLCWLVRGALHAGVVAAALGPARPALYGGIRP